VRSKKKETSLDVYEFSIERILRDIGGPGTPGNRYCFTMVVDN
jgi:hypothetical protein